MRINVAVSLNPAPCRHLNLRATDVVDGSVVFEDSIHFSDLTPQRLAAIRTEMGLRSVLYRAILRRLLATPPLTTTAAKTLIEASPFEI